MEYLVIANPVSVFNLFGWGFLTGSLVAFFVMLVFEGVSIINRKSPSKKELKEHTVKRPQIA